MVGTDGEDKRLPEHTKRAKSSVMVGIVDGEGSGFKFD